MKKDRFVFCSQSQGNELYFFGIDLVAFQIFFAHVAIAFRWFKGVHFPGGVVFEKDERGISETAAGIDEVTIAKIIPDGKIEKPQAVMCQKAFHSGTCPGKMVFLLFSEELFSYHIPLFQFFRSEKFPRVVKEKIMASGRKEADSLQIFFYLRYRLAVQVMKGGIHLLLGYPMKLITKTGGQRRHLPFMDHDIDNNFQLF